MKALLLAYLAGVLIGLWRVDAPVPVRVGLAAVWPLGLLGAATTIPLLLLAAVILFPATGVAAAVLGLIVWWLAR